MRPPGLPDRSGGAYHDLEGGMIVSKAYVAIGAASKYLIQLCKHFDHKVSVD